jgi:hypothetical protein
MTFLDDLVKLSTISPNIGCFYYNTFYFGILLNISYTATTFNFLDLNDPTNMPRGSRFMPSLLIIEVAPSVLEPVNL